MQLMHSVAACSDSHSLMNSESLALVLSPNLMPVGSSRKETMCSDVKTTSGEWTLYILYMYMSVNSMCPCITQLDIIHCTCSHVPLLFSFKENCQ